jgi:glycosyltransferase involved in cell wall biosynthesis
MCVQGVVLISIKKKIFNKYFDESFLKSILVIRYGKKFYQKIYNENILLLVLTKFHKNYLEELGFEEKNIKILPNVNQDSAVKSDTRSNSLVYAGRISKEKGVVELIESFLKADTQKHKFDTNRRGSVIKLFKKSL